jgi:glycosyltransferase involved in cell wall biosynthesis
MTRLLEVSLRCPPEPFVQRKLDGLLARGLEVSVASPLTRDDAKWPDSRIEFHRIPSTHERPLLLPLEVVWSAVRVLASRPSRLLPAIRATARSPVRDEGWSLRKVLAELRAYLRFALVSTDIVHFEWTFSALRWLPLLDLLACPGVVSCRGSDINTRSHDPAYGHWVSGLPGAFERSAAVHGISEAILEEATRYGLDDSKARLIRPAVDPTFFQPPPQRPPDHAGLRLVTIADLRWVKGHEYALLAVRELVERGVPVRLEVVGGDPHHAVGESSERQRILFTISDLGLEEHVQLSGRLRADGVVSRLQQAHVLLHASLSEGVPNVVLEAMACGLPVVVTDAGGTGEAVRAGVDGFVVRAREPGELADAVIALWRNPELRSAMGLAGRRRALRWFSPDRESNAYLRLYEQLARRRDPADGVMPDAGTRAGGMFP